MTKQEALKELNRVQREHPQISTVKIEDLDENADKQAVYMACFAAFENAEEYLRDCGNEFLRRIS